MSNDEKNNNKDEKTKKEIKPQKDGFFKTVYSSIVKIEEYPAMAVKGIKNAIVYLAKLVLILAIIVGIGMTYQTHNMIKENVEKMDKYFPDYEYKDGNLDVKSEEVIRIESEDSILGKTIIDTKTTDYEKLEKYEEEINKETYGGIIILKDKIVFSKILNFEKIEFKYKDALENKNINEFNKKDVVDYLTSSKMNINYLNLFFILTLYAFAIYMLSTIMNIIILSLFGNISASLARMKIKYSAMFSMSVYAITLSIILNMIYIGINIFIPFSMKYFQVMYMAVATIYLIAAIFILKTDIIKQQIELMKIAEVQEEVKKELEEQRREEEANKEKEERKKKDKEEEKKKKEDKSGQAEGQKA